MEEGDENNNDCSDSVTVLNPDADLTVTKVDSPDPVLVGSPLTYTLQVRNNGPSEATNVQLTDTLPAGTTFVSVNPGPPTCSEAGGVVLCNLGTLAVGALTTVTISVTAPPTPGQITNVASVSSDQDDPNPDDNTDSEPTFVGEPTVDAVKTVALAVDSDGSGGATPGDTLRYTVTISNFDTFDAEGVVYTDSLDPNTTLVVGSVTTTAGAVTQGNAPGDTGVEVTIGTLPIGQSVTITYDAIIHTPLPLGTTSISNQGFVTGDNFPLEPTDDPTTSASDDPTEIRLGVQLTATKRYQVINPDPQILYVIEITNVGSQTQPDNPGPEFVDNLPEGTRFLGFPGGGGGGAVFDEANNRITWDGSIAPGETVTIRFAVAIEGGGKLLAQIPTGPGSEDKRLAAVPVGPPAGFWVLGLLLLGTLLGLATTAGIDRWGLGRRLRLPRAGLLGSLLLTLALVVSSCAPFFSSDPGSSIVTVCNQGEVNVDTDGDGTNDALQFTDDPSTVEEDDPTCLDVALGATAMP